MSHEALRAEANGSIESIRPRRELAESKFDVPPRMLRKGERRAAKLLNRAAGPRPLEKLRRVSFGDSLINFVIYAFVLVGGNAFIAKWALPQWAAKANDNGHALPDWVRILPNSLSTTNIVLAIGTAIFLTYRRSSVRSVFYGLVSIWGVVMGVDAACMLTGFFKGTMFYFPNESDSPLDVGIRMLTVSLAAVAAAILLASLASVLRSVVQTTFRRKDEIQFLRSDRLTRLRRLRILESHLAVLDASEGDDSDLMVLGVPACLLIGLAPFLLAQSLVPELYLFVCLLALSYAFRSRRLRWIPLVALGTTLIWVTIHMKALTSPLVEAMFEALVLSPAVLSVWLTRYIRRRGELGGELPLRTVDVISEILAIRKSLQAGRRMCFVVLVDIVGSTKLKEGMSSLFAEWLFREYHESVGRMATFYGGRVISTAGDGIFLAFGESSGAFMFARECLDRVPTDVAQRCDVSPIDLRLAVHGGEAESELDEAQVSTIIDVVAHMEKAVPKGRIGISPAIEHDLREFEPPSSDLERSPFYPLK